MYCGITKTSLPRKFFPSNQFGIKSLVKPLISRKVWDKMMAVQFLHCVLNSFSSSTNFASNQLLLLIKNLISRIFFHNVKWMHSLSTHHSVEITEIYYHSFSAIFCEINVFTKVLQNDHLVKTLTITHGIFVKNCEWIPHRCIQ